MLDIRWRPRNDWKQDLLEPFQNLTNWEGGKLELKDLIRISQVGKGASANHEPQPIKTKRAPAGLNTLTSDHFRRSYFLLSALDATGGGALGLLWLRS